MIERIKSLRGIGLYHDAKNIQNFTFGPATLIYAKNGLGKSTLTSIFRSLATGDSAIIEERRTIDGTTEPAVVVEFRDKTVSSYQKNKWSSKRQEIKIFDSAFVNDNVYSGNDITSEHRKNLLDFAVGNQAVAARVREDKASTDRKTATAQINAVTKTLTTHAHPRSVPVFRALPAHSDSKQQIVALERRRDNAERTASLMANALPAKFVVPVFNLDNIFEILNRTLDDVHAEAESRVAEHSHRLGGEDPQSWLSQGQNYGDKETCPYCGQSTIGVDLIKMYQSHFNEAYVRLRNDISDANRSVETVLSGSLLESLEQHREIVNGRLSFWAGYVDGVQHLDTRMDELAASTLANLRELLRELLAKKSIAPTEKIGTVDNRSEADELWEQFQGIYSDQNLIVGAYELLIESFKTDLQGEDVERLRTRISELQLSESRHSAPVVALFEELASAESALARAESEKNSARVELTKVMKATLDQYRTKINENLKRLGAKFAIDQISTNYLGGTARTDYGLVLRGKNVPLTGGQPSFATALSDGDKRTLAFAFFAASIQSDSDLGQKILVIDDPVSSLDSGRRTSTGQMIQEISKRCSQIVLLAHDEYFLDSVEKMLTPPKNSPDPSPKAIQIKSVERLYSDFDSVDFSELCETGYYRNYRTVSAFVAAKNNDHERAAEALRPLLEGFLHRKYPGILPVASTLGVALNAIDTAAAGSPVSPMGVHVPALQRINEYASSFHHDTDGAHNRMKADPSEVRSFGREILDFLHAVHPV